MKSINIEKFKDFKAKIDYEKIIEKYSDQSVDILHKDSPKSNRPNRKTPYSEGWEVKVNVYKHGARHIVWNKTNWQLTHLLENGHFITNHNADGVNKYHTKGWGRIYWSAPRPHIKPTYRKVRPKFIKAMKKAEVKTILK